MPFGRDIGTKLTAVLLGPSVMVSPGPVLRDSPTVHSKDALINLLERIALNPDLLVVRLRLAASANGR